MNLPHNGLQFHPKTAGITLLKNLIVKRIGILQEFHHFMNAQQHNSVEVPVDVTHEANWWNVFPSDYTEDEATNDRETSNDHWEDTSIQLEKVLVMDATAIPHKDPNYIQG